MKKSTKSMLITALILFCAGLLLALGSTLYVKIAGIDAFGIVQKNELIEDKTINLPQLLATSPESNYVKKLSQTEFTRIDLKSFTGDIQIKAGDQTKIELKDANTNNLQCEIVGETLTIREVDGVSFMGIYIDQNGISFKGLRQIFSTGSAANIKKSVILYLDRKTLPKQIDIDSVFGDVILDGISAETVNLKATFGNVRIQNFKNENTKFNLSGTFTDFDLKDILYTSCNISTKIGNIKLAVENELCRTSVLESWLGDITVLCDVPTSSFKLNLSTTLGSVSRNGETVGNEHSDSSQKANRITSSTIFGDVSLSYTGGNEDDYISVNTKQPETLPQSTEEILTTENQV